MKQLSRHCGLGVLEDTVETPAPKRVLFDLLASPVGEGLLVSCVNRGAVSYTHLTLPTIAIV